MNWFSKAVKKELERRNLKVVEMEHSKFNFISESTHGKKGGIYCKPHCHINIPEKKKLLNLGHKLGLDSVYIASEAYSDTNAHVVKVIELKSSKVV